jgi:hypothetical protein
LTALVAALAFLLAQPATVPRSPPKPVLRAGGERLVMARGSYCWNTPPFGICADTKPPITARGLPVRCGGRVRLNTRLETNLVAASIRGGRRNLRVEPVDESQRRFVIHLRRRMKRRAVLDLYVRYPQGDGSFGARLRVRCG